MKVIIPVNNATSISYEINKIFRTDNRETRLEELFFVDHSQHVIYLMFRNHREDDVDFSSTDDVHVEKFYIDTLTGKKYLILQASARTKELLQAYVNEQIERFRGDRTVNMFEGMGNNFYKLDKTNHLCIHELISWFHTYHQVYQ